ncbi:hypothetical protein KJ980_02965 [Patescibacteria group bacterium]|nr:hypothetical protein [Patescibacteria group bacterium]MBU4098587.1 hypothetical protein [Patescibacteria group bacterium]
MIIKFDKIAEKQLRKISPLIVKKLHKQIGFLLQDFNYPSLHTKKMIGIERFEARIDYHYRFTFRIEKNTILILSIGMHDEGLGKK